jgi:putative transposase
MRPKREHATANGQTYMVTFDTWQRRALFRNAKWAELLIEVLYHYRGSAYFLHEFVVMPDHVHILITPKVNLEQAVQFIKGGFSFRVKKELGSNLEVWQRGFSDHRIRDSADFAQHVLYIHQNPIKEGLWERSEDYLYSSAHTRRNLDPTPLALGESRAA